MLTQGFDLFVEPFDTAGNGPPVFFQLGLTGAPGADATALARQAEAAPAEAGQAVAHLGQFHLQATRGAGGSLGKDVEDQFTPVAHGEVEEPFQIAGLNGGEFPIGHHQGGPNPAGFQGGFGHLALPPDGLGGHLGAALLHHADGDAPGAAHQSFEFADQPLGCAPIAGGQGEEQHPVLGGGHQVGGSNRGRGPLGEGQAGWIRGTDIDQITFELQGPGLLSCGAGADHQGRPLATGSGLIAIAQPKLGREIQAHHALLHGGLEVLGPAATGHQAQV